LYLDADSSFKLLSATLLFLASWHLAILLRGAFSIHYVCEGDERNIGGRLRVEASGRTKEYNPPLIGKEIALGEIRRGGERGRLQSVI
jgi:hypothetical protein